MMTDFLCPRLPHSISVSSSNLITKKLPEIYCKSEMPSISEKEKFKHLILMLGISELFTPQSDTKIFTTEDYGLLLMLLEVCRYTSERVTIPKSMDWINMVLPNPYFDERRFRIQLRMDRQPFYDLINLLKDDPLFGSSQAPLPLQLAVALYNFGTFGNSSGIEQIATKFGISGGAVEKFTSRVIQSLINLSSTWIKWPSRNERKILGTRMASKLLPKCIGYIDGSYANLYQAPLENKETYWSRKKHYCMHFQIVCDEYKRIRHLHTGYPGSVHDAKVFTSSELCKKSNSYFTDGEFIIGDSAYPKSKTIIVPYKRVGGTLDRKQKIFNSHISGQRVAVEHTIGILKGRFQSLQGLRINVNLGNGHKKVCQWILACAVLHNYLMARDPWTRASDTSFMEENDENDQGLDNIGQGSSNAAELKRTALCEIVNAMKR